jgi:phosphoglycerate kinase
MFHFDGIRRAEELDVAQRKVLVRADLDVPCDVEGCPLDDEKLVASVPTLKLLLEAEAQVVVAGHLSGPAGERPPSLEHCGARLASLLGVEVYLPDRNYGLLTRKLMSELRPDRIVLLENLARDPGELENDESFARRLAAPFDAYVGDCLAGPHHFASICSVPKLCADRAMGMRAESELVALNRVLRLHGERIVLVIGGEFSQRQALLHQVLRPNLTVCAGGGLANLLSAASGVDIKNTPYDSRAFAQVRTWLDKARDAGVQVLLPFDANCQNPNGETRQALVEEMEPGEGIVDVGLETVQSYAEVIQRSSCAVMLGGFGRDGRFSRGTRAMLEEVSRSTAFSVVLNDVDLPVAKLVDGDHRARFGFISTAGQAFVSVLCGQRLAGVESLRIPD